MNVYKVWRSMLQVFWEGQSSAPDGMQPKIYYFIIKLFKGPIKRAPAPLIILDPVVGKGVRIRNALIVIHSCKHFHINS